MFFFGENMHVWWLSFCVFFYSVAAPVLRSVFSRFRKVRAKQSRSNGDFVPWLVGRCFLVYLRLSFGDRMFLVANVGKLCRKTRIKSKASHSIYCLADLLKSRSYLSLHLRSPKNHTILSTTSLGNLERNI